MKISYADRESLYSTDQYLQVKDSKDIPKEVVNQIKLVSLPETKEGGPGQPFGSYVNRIADYFGDIDVIQLFSGCCNMKEVGIKTAKAVQEMVVQIKKKPNHYFSEFKAGIDHTYYINVGTLQNGVYTMAPNVLKDSEILYKNKLLTKKEIEIIRIIAKNQGVNGTGNLYDIMFNLFRDKYLLRWTEKEIIQGWKLLNKGTAVEEKKLLSEAVIDKSPVKIDMIVINPGGKFIEVTNFMALGVSNKKNQFIPINVTPADLTPEALPIEIEKLYYSNFHYKPFKIVKRAFAFLKFLSLNWNKKTFKNKSKYVLRDITKEKVDDLINRYVQILQSTVNILYTINSELDAIRIVLDRILSNSGDSDKKSINDLVNRRLDMLKEPLTNVIEIDQKNLDMLMVMIDKITSMDPSQSKSAYGSGASASKVEKIELLKKTFTEIINFWTIAYFDELGLNPPPYIVLPETLSYVDNPSDIIREPFSNPVNPLKYVLDNKPFPLAEAELPYATLKNGKFLTGGSIVSSIFRKVANAYRRRNKEKLPDGRPRVRPLRDGEYHWLNGNYIGPGTHIWDSEVRNYPPFNDVDNCARNHDIAYEKAIQLPDGERQKAIIEADKDIVNCVAKYPNQEGSTAARLGINSKMKLGQVLPMISNAIFKDISSGKTKKGKGRTVKSISEVTDPRLLAPGTIRKYRYRPGEDPGVAKMAMNDAINLVTSLFREDPKAIANAIKSIKQNFENVLKGKPLEPGWMYENGKIVKIGGANGSSTSIREVANKKGKKIDKFVDDAGKNVWVL